MDTETEHKSQNLIIRAAGLLLLLLFFLFFEPGNSALMHRAVWPATAILGAALVLRNLLVLALSVLFFATLNSRPGAADLFSGYIYPAFALLAALIVLVTIGRRFSRRIQTTRAGRWERRTPPASSTGTSTGHRTASTQHGSDPGARKHKH